MIIVVSPCSYFIEGFKSLIEKFISEPKEFKDVIYTDDIRSIKKSYFLSAKAIIVDYGQSDLSCLISFIERKNIAPCAYLIFITRDSCFTNAIENVLINTVADCTIDTKISTNMLRSSLSHLSAIVHRTTNCKERNLQIIEQTHSLTKMEAILLPYIVSGKKNKEISRYINISDKLISHYRRNIYKKFAVDSIGGLYHAFENPEDKRHKEPI